MRQYNQNAHYDIRVCALLGSLSDDTIARIHKLHCVPLAFAMLLYVASTPVASAESISERSFSVRVTVTSNRQLEELAAASRRAAARRFTDRGLPILSPEEKLRIKATTAAPTIHFYYK